MNNFYLKHFSIRYSFSELQRMWLVTLSSGTSVSPLHVQQWRCVYNKWTSGTVRRVPSLPRQWSFKVEVFWVVMSCSVVIGYRRFGGPYCLHSHSEDGGSKVLRNVGILPHHHNLKHSEMWNIAFKRISCVLHWQSAYLQEIMSGKLRPITLSPEYS